LALVITLILIATTFFIKSFMVPFEIPAGGPIIINIQGGSSLQSISNQLADAKVIDSPFLFRMLTVILGKQDSLSGGPYLFDSQSYSMYDVVRRLADGERGFKSVRVTIPEGSNVFAIAKKIHQAIDSIDENDFVDKAQKYEGYLFPDTYFFMPYNTADDVIKQMRNNFDDQVMQNLKLQNDIQNSGHSLQEIITMASILEGEVRTTDDRKMVADILWRRIAKGMPLQVDSTFSYINQKGSADLTMSDLKIDSPYNTYKNKGLPPGPISNPGLDAIGAAANPEPNKYLFFLSDSNGFTHFAETFAEHIKLKKIYIQ
jgi:UPF0755 protein